MNKNYNIISVILNNTCMNACSLNEMPVWLANDRLVTGNLFKNNHLLKCYKYLNI